MVKTIISEPEDGMFFIDRRWDILDPYSINMYSAINTPAGTYALMQYGFELLPKYFI